MTQPYTFKTVTAAILGFAVGGVIALLMTPRTGKQQREHIIKTARSLKHKK